MGRDQLRPYFGEPSANLSRRFFAFLLDYLFLTLAMFALLISGNAVLFSTEAYRSEEASLHKERIECYKIEEESMIYFFLDSGSEEYNKIEKQETTFLRYVDRHIALSHMKDPTIFTIRGQDMSHVSKVEPASFDNDNLAYFVVRYVAANNSFASHDNDILDFEGKKPELYYSELLKKESIASSLFVYDETDFSLPYLKGEAASDLYAYLYEKGNHQSGLAVYNALAKGYQAIWNIEADALFQSSRYQKHYAVFKNNYAQCAYLVDLVALLSYLLSFGLVYLLPQLFFKDSTSLGKKIIKCRTVDIAGFPIVRWQIALKNVFRFFVFLSVALPAMFFAGGADSGWTYPLFSIFSLPISPLLITLVSAFLAFSSFLVSCFGEKKRTIGDRISMTYLIDLRNYVDIYSPLAKEKENEKKDEEYVEDPVFDSSRFHNVERRGLDKKDD